MTHHVDLVVIGLGSGGRSAVELAAQLGASVVGIDKARPGGDCLWTGCVPSKTMLAAARVAHAMRTADRFGIAAVEPVIDLSRVWTRIAEVQESIAITDDDPERLRATGAEIVIGAATITGPNEVIVGDRRIATRHILVTTGSRPAVPPIAGLGAGALTTDTLFALDAPPSSLVIVGAGVVGCELAQGLQRLGVAVTLLEAAPNVLMTAEPTLADRVAATLVREGVDLRRNVSISAVSHSEKGATVTLSDGTDVRADDVLVTAGRVPNVDGFGLSEVGVTVGPHGVVVDGQGQTSVPSIYAAGDCAGPTHLTHWAASAATVAVRSMLLPGRAGVETVVPRCTFVDPELAQVGLTSVDARAQFGDDVEIFAIDLRETDRGRTDDVDGAVILVTASRQRLVGAHVLAPGAGEVIGELALAIRDGRRLNHLAGLLHAYPTVGSAIGTLAATAVRAKAARIGARARRRGR